MQGNQQTCLLSQLGKFQNSFNSQFQFGKLKLNVYFQSSHLYNQLKLEHLIFQFLYFLPQCTYRCKFHRDITSERYSAFFPRTSVNGNKRNHVEN